MCRIAQGTPATWWVNEWLNEWKRVYQVVRLWIWIFLVLFFIILVPLVYILLAHTRITTDRLGLQRDVFSVAAAGTNPHSVAAVFRQSVGFFGYHGDTNLWQSSCIEYINPQVIAVIVYLCALFSGYPGVSISAALSLVSSYGLIIINLIIFDYNSAKYPNNNFTKSDDALTP